MSRERESENEGGERAVLCASDGAKNIGGLEPWNSRWKSNFKVESKTFEIEAEEKKGKMQVIIVERKRGVSSWIKMGPDSLGLFVESLALCIKDTRTGKWVRNWRERGRYSLLRDENKGGCFIRLGVEDLEKKRFNIFIPKGK